MNNRNNRRKSKDGFHGKLASLCIAITAVVALAIWAPNAGAFQNVATCVGCHQIWTGGGGAGHTGHAGLGLGCNSCHASIGDTPLSSTCNSCHVVLGLANHHQNRGAASCTSCHPGTPAPENTPVPGYANLNVALDPCNGSEERFASLTVSLDNDGDLLYDGNDPDCAPPVEDCNDGVDNDGDGMIDCADQDCSLDPACMTPQTETQCADGIDNDMDGQVDCADMDCASAPACQPNAEICNDGMDNDGDGLADCNDPDCAGAANCQPPTPEVCNDGVDNDGDGMIDCNDQDCANNPVCQQPVLEVCTDGIDNDGDGFIDCKDPDCIMNPACKKAETCPQFNPPPSHTKLEDEDDCKAFHAPGYEKPYSNGCTSCHGQNLTGGIAPSCLTCHGKEWDEMPPTNGGGIGAPLRTPFGKCASCHSGFKGGPAGQLHQLHTGTFGASDCMICHGNQAPVCNYCHQVDKHNFRKNDHGDGHLLHAKKLKLDCRTCHAPGSKDGSKQYDRDDRGDDRRKKRSGYRD